MVALASLNNNKNLSISISQPAKKYKNAWLKKIKKRFESPDRCTTPPTTHPKMETPAKTDPIT